MGSSGGAPVMDAESRISARVRIYGMVQGVWYRGWTVGQAKALELHGWVRNRSDGSVEAVFSGPHPSVRTMIERCWQGPSAARVERVEETVEAEPVPEGFTQKPTL
jgi:acylphosphatase